MNTICMNDDPGQVTGGDLCGERPPLKALLSPFQRGARLQAAGGQAAAGPAEPPPLRGLSGRTLALLSGGSRLAAQAEVQNGAQKAREVETLVPLTRVACGVHGLLYHPRGRPAPSLSEARRTEGPVAAAGAALLTKKAFAQTDGPLAERGHPGATCRRPLATLGRGT